MKVKKFVAATMPEAMKKIREELGAEAIILNSKEVRKGGFFGLFKKGSIEVVAALDPQPIIQSRKQDTSTVIPPKVMSHTFEANNDPSDGDVLKEIKYLKKILEQQAMKDHENYAIDYQLLYEFLLKQEVDEELARELIETVISAHESKKQPVTAEQLMIDIQLEIEKRLTKTSFQGMTYDKKIIQFVGPTGVGKTTTLAKVAANCMLEGGKKVAFITTDTYRIAAIEQLKTYARILDVPVEVAYTQEDYKQAIHKFASYDVILVDTAGRNFRDHKYVEELQEKIGLDTKTYLVLSLTAKPKDIIDIYKQFDHLPIHQVIFTKIDETTQYGSMLNITLNHSIGIAYLTNGQDVPDDIIQPSPKKITDYILGGYFNE